MPKFKTYFLPSTPPGPARIQLPFPADPRVRVAQLSRAPLFQDVEAFIPDRYLELESYRPRVLVGYASELQRLSEEVDLGLVDLTCVDHAIVLLTACGSKPMSDLLRVVLWQSFGVPVFELYIGPDHRLLAFECEAHDGWHLEPKVELVFLDKEFIHPEVNFDQELSQPELILDSPGNHGLRTGLSGRIATETCPCGRETPRLMEIAAIQQAPLHAFSASA